MKKIEMCGECPVKQRSRWQTPSVWYCEGVKGNLDLSTIHPDCLLNDVDAVKVKAIEWKQFDGLFFEGFLPIKEDGPVAEVYARSVDHKTLWGYEFGYPLRVLDPEGFKKMGYATYQEAQRAAQTALETFAKGLIEEGNS